MSDYTPTADELIVGTHGYGHRTYEGGWWELDCTGCDIFKGKRLSHLDSSPVDAHVKGLTDRAIAKIRADAKVEALREAADGMPVGWGHLIWMDRDTGKVAEGIPATWLRARADNLEAS